MKKPIVFNVGSLGSPELQNDFREKIKQLDHTPTLGEVVDALFELEPTFNSGQENLKDIFNKIYVLFRIKGIGKTLNHWVMGNATLSVTSDSAPGVKRMVRMYQLSKSWVEDNKLFQLECVYREGNDFVTFLHGDEEILQKCFRRWKILTSKESMVK